MPITSVPRHAGWIYLPTTVVVTAAVVSITFANAWVHHWLFLWLVGLCTVLMVLVIAIALALGNNFGIFTYLEDYDGDEPPRKATRLAGLALAATVKVLLFTAHLTRRLMIAEDRDEALANSLASLLIIFISCTGLILLYAAGTSSRLLGHPFQILGYGAMATLCYLAFACWVLSLTNTLHDEQQDKYHYDPL